MDNRAKKLLFDVLVSGRSIREWCEGRTFSEYETDRQLRKAVEREFEIVGEALNRLMQADPATASRIEDLNRIVGFRNRIIHGYSVCRSPIECGTGGVKRGRSPPLPGVWGCPPVSPFLGRGRVEWRQARRAQPADALYLRLDESKIVESQEVSPGVVLDFNADNQVVGVEILQLSLRAPRLEPGKLAFETTPAAASG